MSGYDFGEDIKPFKYGESQWDLIPAGNYEASLYSWFTYKFINKSKVVFIFSITETGEYFGSYIPAFFEASKLIDKPKEKGRFHAKPTGYLIRAIRRMIPDLPRKQRLDRLPLTKLLSNLYEIEVTDVNNDFTGVDYEDFEKYSKVDKFNIRLKEL